MDLYVKSYLTKEERKRLFIVHGICEHSHRYESFAKELNKKGVSVITYDLRGHGRSSGKKGYINSFKTHLIDLDTIIKKYYNADVENILLGHSMGGLIGNMYMVSNPLVSRFISSGAPTDFLNKVKPFKILPYKPIGFLNVKNKFGEGELSNDLSVEEAYNNDPLVLKTYKIRLAGEMFVSGVKYLKKNINKFETPTLFLHGKNDPIVPCLMSENIYKNLNNPKNKLIIYENMKHEILNEIDKQQVINDIVEWIYE